MASKPFPQKRDGRFTGKWVMKWKPDVLGKWKLEVLGDDPRLKGARPPKEPPRFVLDRHHEFAEKEYKIKNGIALPSARARGVDGYLESYAEAFAVGHKPGSVRQMNRHVRDFLTFLKSQGVTSIQGVTKATCRDYVKARLAVVTYDTIKTEIRYLSPIWTQAIDDGLMAANPWSRLKIPGKSSRKEGTVWTTAEVARIVAHCGKQWQGDLVRVLANTGLRISTALELKWAWVHWAESEFGTIRIPPEAAASRDGVKTAYTHLLSPFAHDILFARHAMRRADAELVFPNPLGKDGVFLVPYDSGRDAVQKAIVAAGVRPGTPHDLRRTYATLLYRATKDLDLVRRQLGHTNLSTTQRYLGSVDSDDADSLAHFRVGDITKADDPGPPRP